MTPHEQGFWNSLTGTPEDLPSHLLFSDWLEEQGRDGEALFHRAIHENKWIPNHDSHPGEQGTNLGWGFIKTWDWWDERRYPDKQGRLPEGLLLLIPPLGDQWKGSSYREFRYIREAYQALYLAWLQWRQK